MVHSQVCNRKTPIGRSLPLGLMLSLMLVRGYEREIRVVVVDLFLVRRIGHRSMQGCVEVLI